MSGQVQKLATDLDHTVEYILNSVLICYFSDLVQEDKDKLSGQVQKLATDLDHTVEYILNSFLFVISVTLYKKTRTSCQVKYRS